MSSKNYFSQQAANYLKFRPDYPVDLFKFLGKMAPHNLLAWDCATGNGQAALGLTPYFEKIVATDVSAEQIANSISHPKIEYRIEKAEKTHFTSNSVDLITIAQALHWFHFESFYSEVNRVLKPSGIIAAWFYLLPKFDNDQLKKILMDFYGLILKDYWAPERKYFDNCLKDIPFPFKKIPTPSFSISSLWSLNQFLGYIETWSAVQKYMEIKKENPVQSILAPLLSSYWNEGQTQHLCFEIKLLMGKK